MKLLLFAATIALFVINSVAQSKVITAADYNGTFQYAVSETNAAFPFIFTVTVDQLKNGRTVSTETEIEERQAAGIERITKTFTKGGDTSVSYQISVGFGSVYCSNDGVTWKGPQKFECSGPSTLYAVRAKEKSEYSVEEKILDGDKLKVYREFVVYSALEASRKKEFKETIATIDSRGFFISIVNNEGFLDPKTVTLIRKQSWNMKTKFKAVVAPK